MTSPPHLPGDGPPNDPILSVAIATRNYGRYLPRALMSALRAGCILGLPFEIVVVDDASTDDTREVLERFRLAHPDRIKAFYRSTTRGIAVAKNAAISYCSGRYIAWLDADDEFLPEKLARCYEQIAAGDVDFVTHDFIQRQGASEQYHMDPTTWAGMEYNFWPPSTWVFRNGLVQHNEQIMWGADDVEWLARKGGTIRRRHVGVTLNVQHVHRGSFGGAPDGLVPCRQVLGRMKGRPNADDRRAPTIWACGACGRQTLLPGTCCGRPTTPAPLLFYSAVDSPSSLPHPEFSFVFLTKNQVTLTERAVDSLLAQTREGRAELIFVDGGSTDGTLAAVRRWAAAHAVKLVLIPPEETFNYSRNCNRGARVARGEYLILVNNDIEICSDGLPHALRAALADPRVGVAGVSTAWNNAQCDPTWDTTRYPYVFTERPLAGHFWGCRREVYWELGGLDEAFTGYGYEELDFQYRALVAHYRMALAAGRVAHLRSATFQAVHGPATMRSLEAINRSVFERKHRRSIYAEANRIEPFAGYRLPEMSVVMVAQNAGDGLRRTLEAAAADPRCQDGSIQLVVVNNGSQDETGLVLAEYCRRLPRLLTVIHLQQPVAGDRALTIAQARAISGVILFRRPGDTLNGSG